jgi:hypothetical protein
MLVLVRERPSDNNISTVHERYVRGSISVVSMSKKSAIAGERAVYLIGTHANHICVIWLGLGLYLDAALLVLGKDARLGIQK